MRILFIGNSHTYVNALPYQVRELVNGLLRADSCVAWMVTSGGKSLAWHAEQPNTVFNIVCNRWDYVVLQQRTHPFPPYAELVGAVNKLLPHIRQSGAEPLYYVTWKKKEAPESDQQEITAAFERLARECGGRVVPVGPAWAVARRSCPDIELYAPDGAHASAAGTYLAACVFCRALTGQSTTGLPARIVVNGTVLAELSPDHAAALQRVADSLDL